MFDRCECGPFEPEAAILFFPLVSSRCERVARREPARISRPLPFNPAAMVRVETACVVAATPATGSTQIAGR